MKPEMRYGWMDGPSTPYFCANEELVSVPYLITHEVEKEKGPGRKRGKETDSWNRSNGQPDATAALGLARPCGSVMGKNTEGTGSC